MKGITIGVAIDSDGHFMVENVHNRNKILEMIKRIDDGDYFENNQEQWQELLADENVFEIEEDRWISFLWGFVQRGKFEILNASNVALT